MYQTNTLDYLSFLLFVQLLPFISLDNQEFTVGLIFF